MGERVSVTRERVPFRWNRNTLAILSSAYVLVGELAPTSDQVGGRLSPEHAPERLRAMRAHGCATPSRPASDYRRRISACGRGPSAITTHTRGGLPAAPAIFLQRKSSRA